MRSLNQRFIILLAACWTAAALVSAHAAERPTPRIQLIDRIVAVVNTGVITQNNLDDRVRVTALQLKKEGIALPPRQVLEKQVLERMITDRIQLQYASQTGIRVDDAQLDQALQNIAQRNHLSLDAFRKTLEAGGVNYRTFRQEIRNEMIIAHLREREINNRITVSDSEVNNYLARHQGQQSGVQYNLAHIFIAVPEQAGPEQIQRRKARADMALEALKSGEPFGQVAASYSEAADAMNGGRLGWRNAARLPELFLTALQRMKPGGISPILRSPSGFHIVRLIAVRRQNAPYIVQQTHVRHILIKTNALTSAANAKHKLMQLRNRLMHGANFAKLARLYSEDTSAANGGDLGWVSPGDTVPPFEHAMNALKPGEISQPVKTSFGWHLIQVLGRREKDVSQERRRLLARKEIRARKADERYQDWLRQLRDQAYVDIRLNRQ
ncbi:MAG TPA: molecular chaperone SurA [Betaproteobacteria bacterium]|nr:molecular chaperone SurA [Betaproteobacteria bacterium]